MTIAAMDRIAQTGGIVTTYPIQSTERDRSPANGEKARWPLAAGVLPASAAVIFVGVLLLAGGGPAIDGQRLLAAVLLIAGAVGLAFGGYLLGGFVARRRALAGIRGTLAADDLIAFVSERDGRLRFLNSRMHELLGELGGASLASEPETINELVERFGPAAGSLELSRLIKGAESGLRDRAEIDLSETLGRRKWFRISAEPVPGLDDLTLWSMSDITATKAAETATRREEKILYDLIDNLPVGFFSVDGSGNLTYANQALRQWLAPLEDGWEAEDRQFADFVVAGGEPDGIAEDASGMHGSIVLKASDGTEFGAYLIQSQQVNADGEFDYSRSIVLREPFLPLPDDGSGGALVKRIPWLFSEAPVGIVLLDPYGNVVDCNRAFLKMLGLHRDAVIGRPLSERIGKEDRDDIAAQLSKVVMGTLPATMIEVRMPAVGERDRAVSLYAGRVQDAEGEVSGLVLHVIDTTEQKNLEVQFNQSQKMQAVGQLAGGVAHDFNNLLTAMIGFCDLLLARHDAEDPSFADIMQIKQNALRAANLIHQLLAFSRRQTLQPKIFDVREALGHLSNLLRRLIGENIALDIRHDQEVDLIRTDPGQFDQVVINLAVNASHAMLGGGQLTIETSRVSIESTLQPGHEVMPAGEYVLIRVTDTGSGIAKEDIEHIFEPFFSTKGVGEGTGLGLSTVYGIVRQSEGYVFVDSASGEGTTFSIYLPAYTAADAAAAGEPILSGPHASEPILAEDLTGGGNILLVEDEDAVRLFGSRALRNKGYRVIEASDGEEALDVLSDFDEAVDLIITDVVMPGMDGHTLVRLIKEKLPEIKVILISGYSEEAIPGDIGADIHFLSKPFSLQDLAGKVKDVIAG